MNTCSLSAQTMIWFSTIIHELTEHFVVTIWHLVNVLKLKYTIIMG